MTSFLALRASVCAYLWCLFPPGFMFYVYFFGYIGRWVDASQFVIYSANLGRRPLVRGSSGLRIESAVLTLIIFFHLSGPNFC